MDARRAAARVLVIDEATPRLDHAIAVLLTQGHDVESVATAELGARRLAARSFDLVAVAPADASGGLEALRGVLRRLPADELVPILFLDPADDPQLRAAALELGATAVLARSGRDEELLAQVRSLLAARAKFAALREHARELEHLSVTDGLTSLYNHRWFQLRLREEFRRAQRYGDPLALILLDLDRFKQVNDRWGHQVGDTVLREFSTVLQGSVRETDFVARYGGEEFCVLLPCTSVAGALTVAERIREESAAHLYAGERALRCTVSIGLASLPSSEATGAERLLHFADEAVYRAKQDGRDRVVIWRPSFLAAV